MLFNEITPVYMENRKKPINKKFRFIDYYSRRGTGLQWPLYIRGLIQHTKTTSSLLCRRRQRLLTSFLRPSASKHQSSLNFPISCTATVLKYELSLVTNICCRITTLWVTAYSQKFDHPTLTIIFWIMTNIFHYFLFNSSTGPLVTTFYHLVNPFTYTTPNAEK
jgi:hypothetical protein